MPLLQLGPFWHGVRCRSTSFDTLTSGRRFDVCEMVILNEARQIFQSLRIESFLDTIVPRLSEGKDGELQRSTAPGQCVGV